MMKILVVLITIIFISCDPCVSYKEKISDISFDGYVSGIDSIQPCYSNLVVKTEKDLVELDFCQCGPGVHDFMSKISIGKRVKKVKNSSSLLIQEESGKWEEIELPCCNW